jgi:hypothetical protein
MPLYAEVNTENVLRSVAKVAKSTLIRVLGRLGKGWEKDAIIAITVISLSEGQFCRRYKRRY